MDSLVSQRKLMGDLTEAREPFNLLARHQAERSRKQLTEVTAAFQTLPASAEAPERLCPLSPGYRTRCNL